MRRWGGGGGRGPQGCATGPGPVHSIGCAHRQLCTEVDSLHKDQIKYKSNKPNLSIQNVDVTNDVPNSLGESA